jgi:uncharacterized membrane protein (DUF2068 family)
MGMGSPGTGARALDAAEHRESSGMTTATDSARGLLIIGVFKVAKGLLLLAAAVGMLKLLHHDVAGIFLRIITDFSVDPQNRHLHRVLVRLWGIDDRKLKELSAGSFFYAGLLLTEGIGLLARKRWAEYFTIIVTGSFIPLELYELIRHFTAAKVIVVAVNVAVVWYLVRRRLESRRVVSSQIETER